MVKKAPFLLMALLISFASWGSSLHSNSSMEECLAIAKMKAKGMQVVCGLNHQHFNAKKINARAAPSGKLKIAGFNLWNFGSLTAQFKDLKLVAEMMDQWDIVAASEVLPVVGADATHNRNLLEAIEEKRKALRSANATEQRKIKKEISEFEKLYRTPGHFDLLLELRKLDSSWSLILAPTAEAAESGSVHELVGFYYRGKTVSPVNNRHCQEESQTRPYACFPSVARSFMGRDVAKVFSRRPFMASFKSGDFSFALLTSHIIFGSPQEEDKIKDILNLAFGVDSPSDLGRGVTKQNYARAAELKVTMEMIARMKERNDLRNIIYVGDTNLNHDELFWDKILAPVPGHSVEIDRPTTLTIRRQDTRGNSTNGLVSSYDHFIRDRAETQNCGDAKPFSFLTGSFARKIEHRYLVRDDDGNMTSDGRKKMDELVDDMFAQLNDRKTVRKGKIVADNSSAKERTRIFKERVFESQLKDESYYRVFMETMSDHLPIVLECDR
jgi:hypothetical protein